MIEALNILKWLSLCFAVSFLMRPYLCVRRLKLPDAGFAASLALGTALSFYASYILSAIGLFPFDEHCAIVFFILALLPFCISVFKQHLADKDLPLKEKIRRAICRPEQRKNLRRFLLGFALFAFFFLCIVWIRGYKNVLTCSTEQYMDFGFVQAIFRQRSAIPEDIWFSGNTLNYYYLGQACTAFLCRLSGVTPAHGYPFMLATIFSGAACMVFSLVSALTKSVIQSGETEKEGEEHSFAYRWKQKFPILTGGVCGMLMACFAGNGHYLVYRVLSSVIGLFTGQPLRYKDGNYFFPDSTSFIGYYPDTPDKGKTEFLAYSVILGDLHAHMINQLFVLALLVIVLDYALDTERKERTVCRFLDARFILIAVLLSLFTGCNYWDLPIYFVVAGALILFHDLRLYGDGSINRWLLITARVVLTGALILGAAKLLSLPFTMHFVRMASQIGLCQNHTPFGRFALLWGIPVAVVLAFLTDRIIRRRKHVLTLGDQAVILIGLCAAGLILVPEVIYVKDIYGEEFARFNTMFKLTYQAFLLFAIVTGCAIGLWMHEAKQALLIPSVTVTILLSGYFFTGVHQFMGNVFDLSERSDSNVCDFLTKDPELFTEMNAIYLINEDERTHVRVLEAGGESYTPDNKVSVFTGACTYAGWGVHEWMWRGGWDIVGERMGRIRDFYMSGDEKLCRAFVEENGIDYVMAGPREYAKYAVNTDGFAPFMEEIFRSEEGYTVYKMR
ncbi:MAG: hypothetical protein J6Y57_08320 [Lachnospiraceae bacterium]|nr:hypothetical protein [Lachnospiraceae bacterium]